MSISTYIPTNYSFHFPQPCQQWILAILSCFCQSDGQKNSITLFQFEFPDWSWTSFHLFLGHLWISFFLLWISCSYSLFIFAHLKFFLSIKKKNFLVLFVCSEGSRDLCSIRIFVEQILVLESTIKVHYPKYENKQHEEARRWLGDG